MKASSILCKALKNLSETFLIEQRRTEPTDTNLLRKEAEDSAEFFIYRP